MKQASWAGFCFCFARRDSIWREADPKRDAHAQNIATGITTALEPRSDYPVKAGAKVTDSKYDGNSGSRNPLVRDHRVQEH